MNKIQDGFYAGGDSYKPLVVTLDRVNAATVSFVNDLIIIRGINGAVIDVDGDSDETSLRFKIVERTTTKSATTNNN